MVTKILVRKIYQDFPRREGRFMDLNEDIEMVK
jgi:hypothetical protein